MGSKVTIKHSVEPFTVFGRVITNWLSKDTMTVSDDHGQKIVLIEGSDGSLSCKQPDGQMQTVILSPSSDKPVISDKTIIDRDVGRVIYRSNVAEGHLYTLRAKTEIFPEPREITKVIVLDVSPLDVVCNAPEAQKLFAATAAAAAKEKSRK